MHMEEMPPAENLHCQYDENVEDAAWLVKFYCEKLFLNVEAV